MIGPVWETAKDEMYDIAAAPYSKDEWTKALAARADSIIGSQ